MKIDETDAEHCAMVNFRNISSKLKFLFKAVFPSNPSTQDDHGTSESKQSKIYLRPWQGLDFEKHLLYFEEREGREVE